MWLLRGPRGMAYRSLALAHSVLLVLLVAAGAQAQARAPQLQGTVKDQTGGVIFGAQVTVTAAGRTVFTGQTDNQGRFHIAELPAGTFTLTVAQSLFAPFTTTVTVSGAPVPPFDITLFAVINIQEEVTSDIGLSPQNLSSMLLKGADIAS